MDAADIAERLTRAEVHEHRARIVGTLDLRDRRLDHALILEDCYVEEPIWLRETQATTIRLRGCHLWGLEAAQLRTRGDLDLTGSVTTGQIIVLEGAHIGGQLCLSNARLSNVGGIALAAHAIVVDQGVQMADASIKGTIRFGVAKIGGQLYLNGTKLFAPAGISLWGNQLTVEQGVYCGDGFESTGDFQLRHAHIKGQLSIEGATFANWAGTALDLENTTIDQGLLAFGITARGEVDLTGLTVRGHAAFSGASLSNPCGTAVRARGLVVGRSLIFDDVRVRGAVELVHARIADAVAMTGAVLSNPGGIALEAAAFSVGHDVLCDNGFTAKGEVALYGAKIGASISFSGATLANPSGSALSAAELSAGRGIILAQGLATDGSLSVTGARAGWLNLGATKIDAEREHVFEAALLRVEENMLVTADLDRLDLTGGHVGGLRLRFPAAPEVVDLTNTTVGVFEDRQASWPKHVRLHGFTCDTLQDDNVPVSARLEYLSQRAGHYEPGTYDNLAAAYRRNGRVEHARLVSMAKQRHRRTELNPFGRLWDGLLFLTVGYGYRTSRAWLWLAALVGAGAAVYVNAEKAATGATVPAFNPFVYAFDVLIPIVDLGQEKAWVVRGAAQYVSWGLIVAGWILTTAVVTGLTNALKRD